MVVEHKDRLSRVCFGWFEMLLSRQGNQTVVARLAADDDRDLMEGRLSIIYSDAARLYGLRGHSDRVDKALKHLESEVG